MDNKGFFLQIKLTHTRGIIYPNAWATRSENFTHMLSHAPETQLTCTAGFKIPAAGDSRHFGNTCRQFFIEAIENYTYWLAKSTSLEHVLLNKYFISEEVMQPWNMNAQRGLGLEP